MDFSMVLPDVSFRCSEDGDFEMAESLFSGDVKAWSLLDDTSVIANELRFPSEFNFSDFHGHIEPNGMTGRVLRRGQAV